MSGLERREDLSVGVEQIDAEHRRLLGLVSELHVARSQPGSDARLPRTLDGLVAHANVHFGHEEAAMERASDPSLVQHRLQHTALTEKELAPV